MIEEQEELIEKQKAALNEKDEQLNQQAAEIAALKKRLAEAENK
jgi:hypothetical protein